MTTLDDARAQRPGVPDDVLQAGLLAFNESGSIPQNIINASYKRESDLRARMGYDIGGGQDTAEEKPHFALDDFTREYLGASKKPSPQKASFDLDRATQAYMAESVAEENPVGRPDGGSDVARGFSTAMKQLPQLGYGLLAGAGAVAESVLGEGGVSSSVKKFGVEKYNASGADMQKTTKDSDSLTYSWDQAKQGNFGALVDWMQYGIGYGGAQAIQALATGGIGAVAGKMALKTVAETAAAGMVKKEMAAIAIADVGKTMTAEAATALAVKNVASKIGQTTAIGAQAFGMEGGEIFGDLASDSEKRGTPLAGSEMAKAFGATLAAGGLEFVGDKLGFDLMVGKSKLFSPAGAMTGLTGKAARAGVAAVGAIPIEAGTEYLQTGFEEYGKGNEKDILPFNQSADAQKQAFDAAGLGGFGGGVMAVTGGAVSSPEKAAPASPPRIAPEQITAAITDPAIPLDEAIARSAAATDLDATGATHAEAVMKEFDTLRADGDRAAEAAAASQPTASGLVTDSSLPLVGQLAPAIDAQPIVTSELAPVASPQPIVSGNETGNVERQAYGEALVKQARGELLTAADTVALAIPPSDVRLQVERQNSKANVEPNQGTANPVSLAVEPSVAQQQLADNEAGRYSPERAPTTEQLFTEDAPVFADETVAPVTEPTLQGTPNVATTAQAEQSQPEAPAAPSEVANPHFTGAEAEAPHIATLLQSGEGVKVHAVTDINALPTARGALAGARMSRHTARAIKSVMYLFGRKVQFYEASHDTHEGVMHDGKTIYVNVDGGIDAMAVAGHEFTHTLKHTDPKSYDQAHAAVVELLTNSPERRGAYAKYLNNADITAENTSELAHELLADIGGNEARTGAFWGDVFDQIHRDHPHAEARAIITRLRDALVKFIDKLIMATPKSGFEHGFKREELTAVRELLVKMARDSFVRNERQRLGLSVTPTGRGVNKGNIRYTPEKEEKPIDVSRLQDDERYYKSDLVKRPAAEVRASTARSEELSPGTTFWAKIRDGESFTPKELKDAYSIGRRGTVRSGSQAVPVSELLGAEGVDSLRAASTVFYWLDNLAGFGGYYSIGRHLDGQDRFIVSFIPGELFKGKSFANQDDVLDNSVVTFLFSPEGGTWKLDLIDPGKETPAYAALAEKGRLEFLDSKPESGGDNYVRAVLDSRHATTRALMQESIRRLAIFTKTIPSITVAERDTGARAGDKTPRTFSSDKVQTQFSTARAQTETPAFKKWFGDWQDPKAFSSKYPKDKTPVSHAVNEDGSPLILYHATNADFNTFEPGRPTINSTTFGDVETERHAIFTSPDSAFSEEYLKNGAGQNVMPVFMDVKAPMDMRDGPDGGLVRDIVENSNGAITRNDFYNLPVTETWSLFDGDFGKKFVAAARAAGYDGAIIRENTSDRESDSDVWIAFDPTQIKSAIGNNGQFDGANPDIRYSAQRLSEELEPKLREHFKSEHPQIVKLSDNTPATLQLFGWADMPVVIQPDVIDKMHFDHGMTIPQMANLPFLLQRPMIIFGDAKNNSLVFIGEQLKPGKPVLVAVKPVKGSSATGRQDTAMIVTGYDPQNGWDEVAKRLMRGELVYRDTVQEGPASLKSFVSAAQKKYAQGSGRLLPRELLQGRGASVLERAYSVLGQSDLVNLEKSIWPDGAKFSTPRILGDSGRQYTPEQQALHTQTGREISPQTTLERLKKWADQRWIQVLFDQFDPIKDLDETAYRLTRQSKGATGAFEAFMNHGKLSIVDGTYDADNSGGVMQEVFIPIGRETTDFLYWVAGNRAERLASEGKERLFSPANILAAKSLADGTTDFDYVLPSGQATRDRTLVYKDTLRKFNEFSKNVMDMAEQSGLIDGASRHLWEHEFYVPFYRVIEEKDGSVRGMNIKKGIVRQTSFKKLKGGSEGLNDLLSNTMMNWAHLIDAAAKNRAAKATLDAAVGLGAAQRVAGNMAEYAAANGAMLHPETKNTVWYTDKGEQVKFVVEDTALLTAINSLDYVGLQGMAWKLLTVPKHWLTMGVTASPFFKVRNLVRDSVQAIGTSELGYNVFSNLKQGWELTHHERPEYVSALAGGGLIRFGTMLEGNEAKRTRRLIAKGATAEHILDSDSKLRAFWDRFAAPTVDSYNEVGNRSEEMNRMALYNQLRQKGVSHGEAAFQARDLMDFSMQGSGEAVRILIQVVPFMNARLQGMYKLGKSAKEDPAKFAWVLGAVTMASLALLTAYGDDDDWKKREDWDRDNYWWFKVGGEAFRIPKPFEIGAIATLAERSAELMFTDEMNGTRYRKVVGELILNQLSMNPIPQMAKPIIDLYANKDSFSGRPIESMGMEKLDKEYRFTSNTSMPARGLSTATGGVLSPVQIDHLVRGYFSWLGAFTVGAADMAVRAVNDEPTKPTMDYWKFATGGMVSSIDGASSRYVSQVYEQAKALEAAHGTYSMLRKTGKLDEAAEYRDENLDKLKRYPAVDDVKQRMSNLNARTRLIERSAMEPDVKREKILEIQKLKDQQSRRVNQ